MRYFSVAFAHRLTPARRTRPVTRVRRMRRACASATLALTLIVSAAAAACGGGDAASAGAPPTEGLEKPQLTLGFIKLTDMVPLAIAYEKGFFEDEGLYVSLEPQANWKVLLDRVIDGALDGAHMLAGQPLGATIGYGTQADVVTAFSMDLNGNAITVSNEVWSQMRPFVASDAAGRPVHPIGADALAPVVARMQADGRAFKMGMVFPVSTHNYELRYWLAAGGLHPGFYSPTDVSGQIGADVQLSVTPPPQMPATLEAGTIHGYSVGEPWNEQAVVKGIGVPVITDGEIWEYNPEKVLGVTRAWAEAYPRTHVALVKALIRAGMWLDASLANREEAVEILARAEYVGADAAVIAKSMTGTFEYEPGDVRDLPDFNIFFRRFATYPYYSDAIWYLTQMRRWGQIAGLQPDEWYHDVARRVYRPDVYRAAAAALVAEGLAAPDDFPADTDGYRPPSSAFIDGIEYDGRFPNAYIDAFAIGLGGSETP
jgi:nitrate/nitrite transport system substrate-binding protein